MNGRSVWMEVCYLYNEECIQPEINTHDEIYVVMKILAILRP